MGPSEIATSMCPRPQEAMVRVDGFLLWCDTYVLQNLVNPERNLAYDLPKSQIFSSWTPGFDPLVYKVTATDQLMGILPKKPKLSLRTVRTYFFPMH